MSQVFISYRQTNDEQRERVRAFAERLRACDGIDVVLDQFMLEGDAGGPSDGFDKWSSDRALQTEHVLIIGTREWFECFEKTQPPGTGLGAACEADDVRHRLYRAGGLNDDIRIVLFDEADSVHIPAKLIRYRYFHAERDFSDIVRWLGGTPPKIISSSPRTSIPHNLPSLQPFFGREEELRRIADALDPESRTWGALIDGPGGMGKTSLAVRAAYQASPEHFDKIAFVSLKSRELDDDGERDLSGFLISGLAELLNELARYLGHTEIAKATEDQRPRLLLDAFQGKRILLILDNLESLLKRERDVVFTFVKRLPQGCKAILTARGRIGSAAEELILKNLSEPAALATLAALAENIPALAKTKKKERLLLYNETGGNPLLLRWTAGQIGRGSCLTIADAIAYLRSCPPENDPLEFIFGDLVDDFTDHETGVLCALTYFTLPAQLEHITEISGCGKEDTRNALQSLINRSLVVPSEELKTCTLVPLVADFLRKKKPEVIEERGDLLEKRAYAFVVENGYEHYDHFPVLDAGWPTVAAALPRLIAGSHVQTVCRALRNFLEFTGRWDELFAVSIDAENQAVRASDFSAAGWRAYDAAWIQSLHGEKEKMLACSERAQIHWEKAEVGARERASLLRLRGVGYEFSNDYKKAILAYQEALELHRTLTRESKDVAMVLNDLAGAEQSSGDFDAAERDYSEALRMARTTGNEQVSMYLGNLAELLLRRKKWSRAEKLLREALVASEKVGRLELIAFHCLWLAEALVKQGKQSEALTYAKNAVEIFTRLGSPTVVNARMTLAECES